MTGGTALSGTYRRPVGQQAHLATPEVITIVSVTIALLTIGVLRTDPPARDVTIVTMIGGILLLAISNVSAVWLYTVATVPIFHLAIGLFDVPKVSGIRLLLVVTATAMALHRVSRQAAIEAFASKSGVAYGMFIVANLIAAVASRQVESVFRSLTYVEPMLFFAFSYSIVRSRSFSFDDLLRVVVIGGWIVALLGLFEAATQAAVIDTLGIPGLPGEDSSVYLTDDRFGFGGRIMSTIGQPVYAGMYFGIWSLACVAYSFGRTPVMRVACLTSAVVGAALLVLTGARGPILALVASLAIQVLRSWRMSIAATAATIAVAILLTAGGSLGGGMLRYFSASFSLDATETESLNILGRADLTTALIDVFAENPVIGYGPGLIQKAAYRGEADYLALIGLENQYAVILAETGIVGGLSYAYFAAMVLMSVTPRGGPRNSQNVQRVITTMFVFYFVAVTGSMCLTLVPNYILMALAGGTLAQSRLGFETER